MATGSETMMAATPMPAKTLNYGMPPLISGDLVCIQSRSLLGRLIRCCERRLTGNARVSHVAVALGDELMVPPSLVEASWRVRTIPLTWYSDSAMVVYRPLWLTQEERTRVAAMGLTCTRDWYGFGKVALCFLDALFRTYWFTRHFGLLNFKQCANLAAWMYYKGLGKEGTFGPLPWRSQTPDSLDDWCCAHPQRFAVVWNTLP